MADYLDASNQNKTLWLLDTFEGYDSIDMTKDGTSATKGAMRGKTAEEVKELFVNSRTPVRIVKGTIPGTLNEVAAKQISFAHIDVNLYEPTLHSTLFVLERMPIGGLILFDDYNWPATYGARMAIDEACRRTGQTPISLPESSQAFLVRN